MISLFKKKKKESLPARERGNSCLNCTVNLNGNENFCPACGQRNNINQLSFKLFVEEFFGDIFSYDSRLWGTVFPLILKPGKVAYEFISGKRKEFVNPFRTYLTVSLIFFLLYGLLGKISELSNDGKNKFKANIVNINTGKEKDSLSTKQKDSIAKAALANVQKSIPIDLDSTLKANNVNIDSINKKSIGIDSLKNIAKKQSPFFKKINTFFDYYKKNKEHTTTQALDSLNYKNNFWNRFYYDKTQKTHDMINGDIDEFNQTIFSKLSIAIFLFLPIFALFLKFIYIRRKYTYMEHMVFVFYTQTVFFLLLLLFIIVSFIVKNKEQTLIIIAMTLFAIYLLLAMKVFYKQGWIKTLVKCIMANFAFSIIATIGLALLIAISFIFY